MSAGKAQFGSGATSSSEKPRYDLIPLVALQALANRFGYGAKHHTPNNYKQGAHDEKFVRDRINHMIEHAMHVAAGDDSEEQLGAVMCNAAMLLELKRLRNNTEAFERACKVAKLERLQKDAAAEMGKSEQAGPAPVRGDSHGRHWQRDEGLVDLTPDSRYSRG